MKLIILDRDGVINHDSDLYIKSPDEWHQIDGSFEALRLLTQAGYQIAIATNQSGLARGLFSTETLNAIHSKMCQGANAEGGNINYIAFCPHGPDEGCLCRKPKTGLLEQISIHYKTHLNKVPFIGDSFKDIQAGRQMGCHPILVLTGKGLETYKKHEAELNDIEIQHNLLAAVQSLLK